MKAERQEICSKEVHKRGKEEECIAEGKGRMGNGGESCKTTGRKKRKAQKKGGRGTNERSKRGVRNGKGKRREERENKGG